MEDQETMTRIKVAKDTAANDTVQKNIFRTLSYFSVFSYPLTAEQLYTFFPQEISKDKLLGELKKNPEDWGISFQVGYFQLRDDLSAIDKRLRAEEYYNRYYRKAMARAKMIQRFPFVESVSISGTFSKGLADESSDVDFFVITSPNRLWICRTLLVLFKKIFLGNSRQFFCVNYFVSAGAVSIPDKNLFTATEVATLHNVTGPLVFARFMQENSWYKEFLPNHHGPKIASEEVQQKSSVVLLLERFMMHRMGDTLDDFLMNLSLKHWKRKFSGMQADEFNLNLRTLKHVSKHHPRGFQHKVLLKMNEIYNSISQA